MSQFKAASQAMQRQAKLDVSNSTGYIHCGSLVHCRHYVWYTMRHEPGVATAVGSRINRLISNVGKKRCTLQQKETGKDFDVS